MKRPIRKLMKLIDPPGPAPRRRRTTKQQGGPSRPGEKAGRPNPWPKCPTCWRRVALLCTTAEEGAEPCGNGIGCGCCNGPHRAPKPQADRDQFQTSAQRT